MARPPLVTGNFYHIFNRGVEKRRTFMDVRDYRRFFCALFAFNDRNAVLNFGYTLPGETASVSFSDPDSRNLLVDIVAYAFMPNHYHLLLRQHADGGIALFMQKLGVGYTKYFNIRHERSGVLFQGKYQIRTVEDERYLRHLIIYLHLNPLDLVQPDWKTRGTTKPDAALTFLDHYRWSSCQAYLRGFHAERSALLLNTQLVRELGLSTGSTHRQELQQWIRDYSRRVTPLGEMIDPLDLLKSDFNRDFNRTIRYMRS